MSGHSPGPWRIAAHHERSSAGGVEQEIVGPHHVDEDECEFVAVVCEGLDEAGANAHLIAAAPDLLAALEGLAGIIEAAGLNNLANGVQLGQTSWYVKASDRMEAARAAIAKATPEPTP